MMMMGSREQEISQVRRLLAPSRLILPPTPSIRPSIRYTVLYFHDDYTEAEKQSLFFSAAAPVYKSGGDPKTGISIRDTGGR